MWSWTHFFISSKRIFHYIFLMRVTYFVETFVIRITRVSHVTLLQYIKAIWNKNTYTYVYSKNIFLHILCSVYSSSLLSYKLRMKMHINIFEVYLKVGIRHILLCIESSKDDLLRHFNYFLNFHLHLTMYIWCSDLIRQIRVLNTHYKKAIE